MDQKQCAVRVLHLVDDFSRANTGVAATVSQLSGWQAQHVNWVGICTSGAVDIPIPDGVQLFSWPVYRWALRWRYPVDGLSNLLGILRGHKVTLLHVHGVWQAGFMLAMLAAALKGLPVVVSVHGMWAPAALKHGGMGRKLKKLAYWQLLGRWLLLGRAGMHAITPLEAQHIRDFSGRPAKITIPNAIDLTHSAFQRTCSDTRPQRKVVYLGRLHPIKGPDLLIDAFSDSNLGSAWELVLAGPEEVPSYADNLRALAVASNKSAQIRFVGPCYGLAKRELLASAWVVVVPSHSEVVGMVNLEAASLCTPTITTHATGLVRWQSGGGLLSESTLDGLRTALNAAMAWSSEERIQRGNQVRRMVEQEFSLESVGAAWLRFYWDLGSSIHR